MESKKGSTSFVIKFKYLTVRETQDHLPNSSHAPTMPLISILYTNNVEGGKTWKEILGARLRCAMFFLSKQAFELSHWQSYPLIL